MTPEEWNFVKEAFEVSRGLTAQEREGYLSGSMPSREARAEVESLLAMYASDTDFLEEPALQRQNRGFADPFPGTRIGCYEIIRRVGEGGMSTVYEGYRSDNRFRQRTAIKVVKRGMDTEALLLRFRTERQILAEFQHRHIAQLLDGGELLDGRPFLVMEFIDGEPITEFCDARKLPVSRRLELFLQVCSAVQAAHQNLIVHRDIKPSNILVTHDGECKLLDFGIAKMLAPERYARNATQTLAAERMLTPDYASPEQIRGEPVTTASDIYSLGVLLYELLAGTPPHRFGRLELLSLAKAMETQEIERPSAALVRAGSDPDATAAARASTPHKLRRALKGDLDNIVLRALRRAPERRYRSVEQLADDLRRHGQELPVTARKETIGYVASKFLARNRALSAVAAMLFLAILAGTAAALWQANRAEKERERAARGFADVRHAANSLIFELHAAIEPLRGSRPARELILRRATEMLKRLEKEAGKDAALNLELAAGYRRLGDVEGNPLADNGGNKAAAAGSYHEAIRLGEAALAADPQSEAARLDLAASYQNLSSIAGVSEAESAISNAIRLHEELLSKAPSKQDLRGALGVDYQRRGALRTGRGDYAGAMEDQRRSLDLLRQAAAAPNATEDTLAQLSFAYKRVGALLIHERRLEEALRHYQAALEIDEKLITLHPTNAKFEFNKTFAYTDMGVIYHIRGEFLKAIEYHRKALAIREAQAHADPANVRAQQGVFSSLSNLAFNLRDAGDLDGSLDARLRAIAVLQGIEAAQPDNKGLREVFSEQEASAAEVTERIAQRLRKAGCTAQSRKAKEQVEKAVGVLAGLKPAPEISGRMRAISRQVACPIT